MSLRSQSLRTRLVALAMALVAFGVVATSIATYFALHSFLYHRLDDELASTQGIPVRPCLDVGARFRLPPPLPPGTAVDVLDTTGAQVVEQCQYGPAVPMFRVDGGDVPRLTANPGQPMTVRSDKGEFRAVAFAAITRGGGDDPPAGSFLVFGKSTGDASGTLAKLLGLEVIAGALVLAAVAALGTVGVRLGLRPLDRVTRTAQAVAAELSPDGSGLDRRVEVTDPDTEVGQLAEAVNTMLDAVETEYTARYESEQRMRRFLADASHELRTPLTSLRGYAELIRLRGNQGTDADARDALRRIEAEGTRMSRLVDDLLTLARYDRGAVPEWEPVALTDVVADAVAGVHAAHPDRTITMVDPRLPATVLGDRDQLLQVVRNVLTNAATHTETGPITVVVSTMDGAVEVVVRDTGPGLTPEQAARVFDRFWRADVARTRIRGGSGLGLSIVHALLATHGGRVGFESSPTAGTTVTIRLPAAPAGTPPPKSTADTTSRTAASPVRT
jgi:two-component system OmpR family sensor kinase